MESVGGSDTSISLSALLAAVFAAAAAACPKKAITRKLRQVKVWSRSRETKRVALGVR